MIRPSPSTSPRAWLAAGVTAFGVVFIVGCTVTGLYWCYIMWDYVKPGDVGFLALALSIALATLAMLVARLRRLTLAIRTSRKRKLDARHAP